MTEINNGISYARDSNGDYIYDDHYYKYSNNKEYQSQYIEPYDDLGGYDIDYDFVEDSARIK